MRASVRDPCLAAVIAVAIFAVPANAPAAEAGTHDDPRDLVLRLRDVGAGYRVGDDGACLSRFGAEGTTPALVELDRRHRFRSCAIEFNRIWRPPAAHAPEAVDSAAFVFADVAGAAAGFQAGPDLVAFMAGASAESLVARTPARPLGDKVVVFETRGTPARGGSERPEVAVAWRTGRVLAVVSASGLGAPLGEARVLALAERQQARIASPTQLGPRDNDDLEVPLDDPQLAGIVRWLGRSYDPPGRRLGRLTLQAAYNGDADGPGSVARLEYAPGLTLELWRPRAFAKHSRTRLGRLVWSSQCAVSTAARVHGGRAVIYSGYGPRSRDPAPMIGPIRLDPGIESGPCPRRPRDRMLAHVTYRDAVLTINAPSCFSCIALPRRDPFNSIAGLRAVIEALSVRRPATRDRRRRQSRASNDVRGAWAARGERSLTIRRARRCGRRRR